MFYIYLSISPIHTVFQTPHKRVQRKKVLAAKLFLSEERSCLPGLLQGWLKGDGGYLC